MIVSILAKDVGEFSIYLDEVLTCLKGKLLDYSFFIVISASQLGYKKIYDKVKGSYEYHAKIGPENPVKLSRNDLKVLKVISNNARLPTADIARKAKISIERVRYTLKKLEKQEVVQGYKPLMDVSRLGIRWDVIFLRLKSIREEQKEEMINYLKELPEVFYVVQGVGNCNLMIEFQTSNSKEFEDVRTKIGNKFSSIIADEKAVQLIEEHKCTYFPGVIDW